MRKINGRGSNNNAALHLSTSSHNNNNNNNSNNAADNYPDIVVTSAAAHNEISDVDEMACSNTEYDGGSDGVAPAIGQVGDGGGSPTDDNLPVVVIDSSAVTTPESVLNGTTAEPVSSFLNQSDDVDWKKYGQEII